MKLKNSYLIRSFERTGKSVPGKLQDDFCKLSMLYAFRIARIREMKLFFHGELGLDTTTTKNWRFFLDSAGYVCTQLKPFVFRCMKHRKDIDIKKEADSFDIMPADRDWVAGLMADKKYRKLYKPLFNYKAYDASELSQLINWIFNDRGLKEFLRKNVKYKLLFVYRNPSSGVTAEDLESQCRYAAFKGVRTQYPKFDKPLHAFNTAKTCISNTIVNLQKHYNCEERKVLQKTEDGNFEAVTAATDSTKDYLYQDDRSNMVEQQEMELLYSRIMGNYADSKKWKRNVVKSLFGRLGTEFDDYIMKKAPKDLKLSANRLYNANSQVYEDYLIDFLGINRNKYDTVRREVQQLMHIV